MSNADTVASGVETRASRRDTAFIGHPIGLAWLSGAEFFERFSYYGMQALLVLYMTEFLLLPGHVDHVMGFEPFRRFLGWLYGAHSPQELASGTFGLYAGLVYVTPLGGGFIADRFIGRTRAVTIGASLMALGHFLMAFDVSFLLALLCLLTGVGFFKGNIASQVGDLYAIDDLRRADAFQIYFLGIQLAVIGSPLVCGSLGEKVAWHWGFGAAGVGMVIGLCVYLMGRYSLPPEPVRKKKNETVRPPLTGRDWRTIAILVALLPVLALSLVSNNEIFNAYILWAKSSYQLVFFGETMPVTWMLSVDAIVSTITMIGVIAFWRWWGTKWKEPDEITKIAIGVAISACAPLVLAAASVVVAATKHPVPIYWAFAFHTVNDIGFANVLPVGLALYSRAAPRGLGGLMIAIYYLHLFMGNIIIGKLGGLYGTRSDVSFWLLHAGLMAISAVILIGARFAFASSLAPTKDEMVATPA